MAFSYPLSRNEFTLYADSSTQGWNFFVADISVYSNLLARGRPASEDFDIPSF
jgi:hypothetical protein